MFTNIMLLLLLLIAIVFDLKERRIPNWLILIGLIMAFTCAGYESGLAGLFMSFKGMILGIILLIIPFAMGGMGAGDVKLLGMVGAFKGTAFVINTFLWMSLWGGLIALGILIYKQELGNTFKRMLQGVMLSMLRVAKVTDSVSKEALTIYFPYALAIGLGAITSFFKGWW